MPVLGDDVDGVDDVSGVVERVKVGPVAQVIRLEPGSVAHMDHDV
jgi:hypothetical protein